MKIPKLYIALTMVLIMCAVTVGYKLFTSPTGSSSSKQSNSNKKATKTHESASALSEKNSSKTSRIKSTGNEKQPREKNQKGFTEKISASANGRPISSSTGDRISTILSPKKPKGNTKGKATLGSVNINDFYEVLNEFNTIEDRAERQVIMDDLIQSLTFEDPRVALAILNRIEGKSDRYQFSSKFINSLLENDPQEAIEWVEAIQDDDWIQKNLYYVLGKELVDVDPQALTPWIDSISDETLRGSAIDGIAYQWALTDPEAAYNWVSSNLPETEGGQALLKIAQGMSKNDEQGAALWISQFP